MGIGTLLDSLDGLAEDTSPQIRTVPERPLPPHHQRRREIREALAAVGLELQAARYRHNRDNGWDHAEAKLEAARGETTYYINAHRHINDKWERRAVEVEAHHGIEPRLESQEPLTIEPDTAATEAPDSYEDLVVGTRKRLQDLEEIRPGYTGVNAELKPLADSGYRTGLTVSYIVNLTDDHDGAPGLSPVITGIDEVHDYIQEELDGG